MAASLEQVLDELLGDEGAEDRTASDADRVAFHGLRMALGQGAPLGLAAFDPATLITIVYPDPEDPEAADEARRRVCDGLVSLAFKVEALRAAVDPEVRDALTSVKRPFASAYDLAPLLGIETPRSAKDEDDADVEPESDADTDASPATVAWDQYHNLIFFGPPGTGKSYQLQQIVELHLRASPDRVYRVTFHPEFSYFDFVGTYKPRVGWMKSLNDFTDADRQPHANREPRVYYAFDPGPFSRALVQAIRSPGDSVVVIVEEINRGNCAAIFGDVFQLLDRVGDDKPDERGRSEYPIVPSAEWKGWLDEQLDGISTPCWVDGRLRLPGNLYLYATMNTSDQSLFPMDTAFRRRWGLQYVGSRPPQSYVHGHGWMRTIAMASLGSTSRVSSTRRSSSTPAAMTSRWDPGSSSGRPVTPS